MDIGGPLHGPPKIRAGTEPRPYEAKKSHAHKISLFNFAPCRQASVERHYGRLPFDGREPPFRRVQPADEHRPR